MWGPSVASFFAANLPATERNLSGQGTGSAAESRRMGGDAVQKPLSSILACSGTAWGRLGAIVGHLGATLGHPAAVFLDLGAIWGRLGVILACPWAVLGPSWAILGPSWGLLGAVLRPSWGPLGAILGPSWGYLGALLGGPSKNVVFCSESACYGEKPLGARNGKRR